MEKGKILEDLLSELRRQQSYMTADARINLWNEIRKGYCHNCGYWTGDDVCHCENDD